jgi:hypothetical protein
LYYYMSLVNLSLANEVLSGNWNGSLHILTTVDT